MSETDYPNWECRECGEIFETPNEKAPERHEDLPPLWCDCGAKKWRRIDGDDAE